MERPTRALGDPEGEPVQLLRGEDVADEVRDPGHRTVRCREIDDDDLPVGCQRARQRRPDPRGPAGDDDRPGRSPARGSGRASGVRRWRSSRTSTAGPSRAGPRTTPRTWKFVGQHDEALTQARVGTDHLRHDRAEHGVDGSEAQGPDDVGSALGISTLTKRWTGVIDRDLASWSTSWSMPRNAVAVLVRRRKKTTLAATRAFGPNPRPNQRMKMGASAGRGGCWRA